MGKRQIALQHHYPRTTTLQLQSERKTDDTRAQNRNVERAYVGFGAEGKTSSHAPIW